MDKKIKVCTWDKDSDCENCKNHNKLNCKWNANHLTQFYIISLPIMVSHIIGLIILGLVSKTWLPLIGYVLFFPIVLGVFEIKFLCSHCPYYDQKGSVLHCPANHGLFKIWKYNPLPMNKLEKLLMKLLVITMIIIMPGIIFTYDIYFLVNNVDTYSNLAVITTIGILVLTIISEISAIYMMYNHVCSKCVNFSCPFNIVEKKYVDEYLKTNLTMKKAWEKSGYKLDE
ncbi:MAG: hypothetical protein ABF289_06915 [Clostridiales bacterium]